MPPTSLANVNCSTRWSPVDREGLIDHKAAQENYLEAFCIPVKVMAAQLCACVHSLNWTLKLVGFIVYKLYLHKADFFFF